MNKIYRVIFNHALGVYQCVGEFAKSAGKTKSIKTVNLAVALAMSTQALAENMTYHDGRTHRIQSDSYIADGDHITNKTRLHAKKNHRCQTRRLAD